MSDSVAINPAEIKTAFSRIGKSIAVITLSDQDGRHATISSAFMNLTSDPATLLFALEKTSSLYAKFVASQVFAINVLGETHQAVVDACARQKGEARFSVGEWMEVGGAPVLSDAQAAFVCHLVERTEFATHGIFVAAVDSVYTHESLSPLVYVGGGLNGCRAI